MRAQQDLRTVVVGVDGSQLDGTPSYGRFPEASPATRAERLHSIVEEISDHQGTVTEHLVTGDPARELTRMARPNDLLVIGRGGLIGSVTSACIRHAHCPVVVVPADQKE